MKEALDMAGITCEQNLLFMELDKGIDDYELGRCVTHEEIMSTLNKLVDNCNISAD